MKILFIDTGNIGRSQMAEALMKNINKGFVVSSAGTNVGQGESEPIHELVIEVIQEKNIDVSRAKRIQLKSSMLEDVDYIIGIFEEHEIPEDLSLLPNFQVWNIDNPKNTNLEFHRSVRDQVEKKILEFVQKI